MLLLEALREGVGRGGGRGGEHELGDEVAADKVALGELKDEAAARLARLRVELRDGTCRRTRATWAAAKLADVTQPAGNTVCQIAHHDMVGDDSQGQLPLKEQLAVHRF